MKRIWIIFSTILIIVLTCTSYVFRDHFPPRTPIKIARIISDLEIPSEVEILNFMEKGNFQGNSILLIEMELNDTQLQDIVQNLEEINYKKLPINEKILCPDQHGAFIFNYVDSEIKKGFYISRQIDSTVRTNGYYYYTSSSTANDFSMTILDIDLRKIFIYSLSM